MSKRSLLGAAAIVLLFLSTFYFYETRQRLKAKLTTTRMNQLADLLRAIEPEGIERAGLERLNTNARREPSSLEDGWGNPLLVERTNSEPPRFRVISLGRDGKKGDCCQRWVHGQWDEDAILEGKDWKQVW